MENKLNIDSEKKVVIQSITGNSISYSLNGEVKKINNQLSELKSIIENLEITKIQYADKIYNIENINEANFEVVISKNKFNGVLTKELINTLKNKEKVKQFLDSVPKKNKKNWETIKPHAKVAQRLIENNFVWVISWELRRLFSIGNDRSKSVEVKTQEYISHCFSTYRLSLQLINNLFLSKLWDEKRKNKKIKIKKGPIQDFFKTNRILTLGELHILFQSLIAIFIKNKLSFPVSKDEFGNPNKYLDPNSKFNQACNTLESLENLELIKGHYDLGQCHLAEISIVEILKTFDFFTSYQLVTMKKVEYEETRNGAPRYVKDFSILEKKETKKLLRILKYDNKPSLTYAVFFRNEHNAVNLFPFLLDYNTLTNEQDFQIFMYENRNENNALQYFSIKSEKVETIEFKATKTDPMVIKSEEQKNEEQKNIRLDLAIKQFEQAMNTILDTNEKFQPISTNSNLTGLGNI